MGEDDVLEIETKRFVYVLQLLLVDFHQTHICQRVYSCCGFAEQLKCMLRLQYEANDTDEEEPWKILIFDKKCESIIGTLFNVNELQSYGITLYLLIDSKRDHVPNVPALYFVHPSICNLDIIANDMSNGLYDKFYINFSTQLQRKQLEYLGNSTINNNSYHRISKVFDQYANFVSLTSNLFCCNIQDCYKKLHSNDSDENSLLSLLSEISESLFCTIVTLQKIPLIRAQKGGAAEQIGKLLANKLSKHLQARNNLFSQSRSSPFYNRPGIVYMFFVDV